MAKYLAAYGVTAAVFLALDFVWLTTIALGLYRRELGSLLLDKPSLAISAGFYLIYVAGIVYFCVVPALNGGNWVNALVSGAILGLVAYGTYDITNLATLRNWSMTVAIADLSWGTVLTAISATAGYLIVAALPL
jgi:uncharacterized membrane protein